MFNFHGPPTTLVTPSRVSVSDVGLDSLRNSSSMSNGSIRFSTVSLPPITAKTTRSLTLAPSVTHHYSSSLRPPQQPPKRPTQREMILLTLRHVQSIRGLTFDQLSSFIRGAFELSKSAALDLKLSKTLSNMISRGLVLKIPGLGAYDAVYQLVEESESSSLDLSVRGRSVQEVPMWPSGYSLPNGGNFVCRSSPQQQQQKQQQHQTMGSDINSSKNPYFRRNPLNQKLDPMPYMPLTDPMICQSFGARVGLTGQSTGQRPNSPTTTIVDDDHDEGGAEFDYSQGMWMSAAAVADKNSTGCESTPRDAVSPFDRHHHPQIPLASLHPNNNDQFSHPTLQSKSQSTLSSQSKEVPRILDTFTSEMEKSLDQIDYDDDGENESKFYINHIHDDSPHHQLENFTGDIAQLDCPDIEGSKYDKRKMEIFGGHYAPSRGQMVGTEEEEQKVETLEEKLKRLSAPPKSGQCEPSSKKLELIQRLKNRSRTTITTMGVGDKFENFKSMESPKELEQNYRACAIMNDFTRRNNKHEGGGDNGGEQKFDNQIDYLMGIADIIDSYGGKPPSNLSKSRGAAGGGVSGITKNFRGITYRK